MYFLITVRQNPAFCTPPPAQPLASLPPSPHRRLCLERFASDWRREPEIPPISSAMQHRKQSRTTKVVSSTLSAETSSHISLLPWCLGKETRSTYGAKQR